MLMKEHAKEYRKKLEHEIIELMQMPCNERTAEAIVDLAECYEKVMALEEGFYHHVLSDEEIKSRIKELFA